MSTFLSQARSRALRPAGPLPRPRLTIVPRVVARAPKIPFVLLVVTVLAAGLVGLLMLNISLQRGAYVDGALRSQAAALGQREQDLEMSVSALQEPQRVSREASRLGMVQNDSPVFLVLGTGKVIGVPTVGQAVNSLDIGLVPPGSGGSRLKVVEPPAGSHNSLGGGAEVVKAARPGRHPASTNAADTGAASASHRIAQGRKNSSNP